MVVGGEEVVVGGLGEAFQEDFAGLFLLGGVGRGCGVGADYVVERGFGEFFGVLGGLFGGAHGVDGVVDDGAEGDADAHERRAGADTGDAADGVVCGLVGFAGGDGGEVGGDVVVGIAGGWYGLLSRELVGGDGGFRREVELVPSARGDEKLHRIWWHAV